ncbi:hypothetical protein Taro_037650 [Colocasia esculenta]|uniref:Autophagy-related protein 18g n=1 Tax=Colocasia esculenta TaxID=4460 RepID=A0A843WJW7_COLES|nr:hypothetical protein [Colocasia esculenta]
MQPVPAQTEGFEGFRASHPLLLVVAGDETNGSGMVQGGRLSALVREHSDDAQVDCISMPTVVRFFSLRSHSYVHVLRFRSAVYIVRCSRRIVAVALAAQIYCFDAVTLENKFSVLTYPMQGPVGINVGLGPLAVGPRWLAYASNNPLLSNTGRLSPQNLTPSPGVSPSTSPSSGSLVARYAMESSKQLAAGIISLGDMGYKTLSKYCQDLLPDGSNSPTSTHFSRKTGRLASPTHLNEVDNAGMVVIKDLVSKEVISQFRAHTSPISALCFDPSGTLLVTASVHGNNINVFRIMPTRMSNGPSSTSYDWTSSHIHLYKLYRGITTAVIQDICFSHYSQWVAIVSSHGTCHIFVLSPFGGSAGLQVLNFHSDGPVLTPSLSLPWWSTSTFMKDQFLPPPAITLSVVGRIKNGNSGWLNSVSNIAASAGGKIPTPSGAVAAVFHNSVHHNPQPFHLKAKALENLLVYAPSGHVIQHELVPNAISESCESNSRLVSGPLQDEEPRVTAEPVQWWDVCRRLKWPEREECISHTTCGIKETIEMVADSSDCEDSETKSSNSSPKSSVNKDFTKGNEKSHWYFSNAEVQVDSGRIPIWQKTKIRFYMMVSHSSEELTSDCGNGEIEIEKFSVNEVEIRRKDLMPVFDHHRELNPRGCLNRSAPESLQHGDKYMGNTVNRHPETVSDGCSDDGSGLLLDSEDIGSVRQFETSAPQSVEMASPRVSALSTIMVTPYVEKWQEENMNCTVSPSFQNDSTGSFLSYAGAPLIKINHSINGTPSNGATIVSDSSTHVQPAESSADSHNMQEFAGYFRNGYCEVSELNGCPGTVEVATDADNSCSHCDKEKPDEDADGDDLLGGVFAFSEEGKIV